MNSGKNKTSIHRISGPPLLCPGSRVEVTSASHIVPTHCVISGRNPPPSDSTKPHQSFASMSPLETALFLSSPHPVNSSALLWQHFTVWSFPTATSQNRQLWVSVLGGLCQTLTVPISESPQSRTACHSLVPHDNLGHLCYPESLFFSPLVTHFTMLALTLTGLCQSQVSSISGHDE